MQDFDLYTGKQNQNFTPRFDTVDPDYFTRMNDFMHREETRSHKKGSRILAFVAGLCIVAFTAGLVIGIKFAGGSNKELVDPHTRQAVSALGQKVAAIGDSTTMSSAATAAQTSSTVQDKQDSVAGTPVKDAYPKTDYPFVIRIGHEFAKEKANEVISLLSSKGNNVIVAKSDNGVKVYAGPFRTMESAEISLQKIRGYNDNRWQNSVILKR